MNKKMIALIIVVTFLVIILIINKQNKKIDTQEINDSLEPNQISEIIRDERTGEYVVYNEKTGEEIARSDDRDSLDIYKFDPYYDPEMPIEE